MEIPLDLIPLDVSPGNAGAKITIYPQLSKGRYKMIFSVEADGYNPTHNSDPIRLAIH